jgi:ELWxxDGT repeat protein
MKIRFIFIIVFQTLAYHSFSQQPLTLLKDINTGAARKYFVVNQIAANNNDVYIATGDVLLKSDGTENSAAPLYDNINFSLPQETRELVFTDDYVYFMGYTEPENTQLWRSDGTTEGTEIVRYENTGVWGTWILSMKAVENTVFFLAVGEYYQVSLYKISGDEEVATLVKQDLYQHSYEEPLQYGSLLAVIENALYFYADRKIWNNGRYGGRA